MEVGGENAHVFSSYHVGYYILFGSTSHWSGIHIADVPQFLSRFDGFVSARITRWAVDFSTPRIANCIPLSFFDRYSAQRNKSGGICPRWFPLIINIRDPVFPGAQDVPHERRLFPVSRSVHQSFPSVQAARWQPQQRGRTPKATKQ